MNNQLTQAELIDLAKQAGFKETVWSNILGVNVESIAKFAQLIQQHQIVDANKMVDPTVKDCLTVGQLRSAVELPPFWGNFIRNICELPDRTSPEDDPEAMIATSQELEGAYLSALEEHLDFPEPVEQGGDELVGLLPEKKVFRPNALIGDDANKFMEGMVNGFNDCLEQVRQALANKRSGA